MTSLADTCGRGSRSTRSAGSHEASATGAPSTRAGHGAWLAALLLASGGCGTGAPARDVGIDAPRDAPDAPESVDDAPTDAGATATLDGGDVGRDLHGWHPLAYLAGRTDGLLPHPTRPGHVILYSSESAALWDGAALSRFVEPPMDASYLPAGGGVTSDGFMVLYVSGEERYLAAREGRYSISRPISVRPPFSTADNVDRAVTSPAADATLFAYNEHGVFDLVVSTRDPVATPSTWSGWRLASEERPLDRVAFLDADTFVATGDGGLRSCTLTIDRRVECVSTAAVLPTGSHVTSLVGHADGTVFLEVVLPTFATVFFRSVAGGTLEALPSVRALTVSPRDSHTFARRSDDGTLAVSHDDGASWIVVASPGTTTDAILAFDAAGDLFLRRGLELYRLDAHLLP